METEKTQEQKDQKLYELTRAYAKKYYAKRVKKAKKYVAKCNKSAQEDGLRLVKGQIITPYPDAKLVSEGIGAPSPVPIGHGVRACLYYLEACTALAMSRANDKGKFGLPRKLEQLELFNEIFPGGSYAREVAVMKLGEYALKALNDENATDIINDAKKEDAEYADAWLAAKQTPGDFVTQALTDLFSRFDPSKE